MSWTRGRGGYALSAAMSRRVLTAFGTGCYQCGERYAQIDHVIPWSEGGPTTLENLRPVCSACHGTKTEAERQRGADRREALKRRPRERHPSEGP